MGGCSSKPKTAEFEEAMEMLEEKPQGEDGKIVEVERIGWDAGLKAVDVKKQETSECGIQNAIFKDEDSCLCNMLADTEGHVYAGFDATGKFKVDRQGLEDHRMNVGKEINGDLSFERQPTVKEEVAKGINSLAPVSSDLHEDVEVSGPRLEETPANFTVKTATATSVEEPFAFLKKSFETQKQPVMSMSETPAAKRHVSHGIGAFHLQQNEFTTPGKDVCLEQEKPMVSQESAVAPEESDLKLQKFSLEQARERAVTQEVGNGDEEQMLDPNPRQKTQVGIMEMESKDIYDEEGKGMVELESRDGENGGDERADNPRQKNELEESKGCEVAANGTYNLFKHREGVALGDKSLLLGKDQSAKGDAVDYDIYRNDHKTLSVEHSFSLDGSVHEEQMQEKFVDETGSMDAFAESFTESHAEPVLKDHWPGYNDLQKKTTGEAFSDESWYILEKVEVQNNDSPIVVSKETNQTSLPKNGSNILKDASRKSILCDDKVLSSSENMVASKEKPGSQPAHVLDPVGFAFQNIVSQEIPALDIDDVFEKLASEFERQESLARSNS